MYELFSMGGRFDSKYWIGRTDVDTLDEAIKEAELANEALLNAHVIGICETFKGEVLAYVYPKNGSTRWFGPYEGRPTPEIERLAFLLER